MYPKVHSCSWRWLNFWPSQPPPPNARIAGVIYQPQFYVVLGLDHQAPCILSKHFTNWDKHMPSLEMCPVCLVSSMCLTFRVMFPLSLNFLCHLLKREFGQSWILIRGCTSNLGDENNPSQFPILTGREDEGADACQKGSTFMLFLFSKLGHWCSSVLWVLMETDRQTPWEQWKRVACFVSLARVDPER